MVALSVSRDKGKHAARPEPRRPQINILPLFVWEKLPASRRGHAHFYDRNYQPLAGPEEQNRTTEPRAQTLGPVRPTWPPATPHLEIPQPQ